MGDSETWDQMYDSCANSLWDAFEVWQDEYEVPGDIIVSACIIEALRYMKAAGVPKKDIKTIFQAALNDYATIEVPEGVARGEAAEKDLLAVLDAPTKK